MHILEKDYHFYAAHRNETLNDKCRNIHGHTYYVTVFMVFPALGEDGLTMLFQKADDIIVPIIQTLDHGMLINANDPLLAYLAKYMEDTGDKLKLNLMQGPTSLENVCKYLFNTIKKAGLPVEQIKIRETTTSTISYYGER